MSTETQAGETQVQPQANQTTTQSAEDTSGKGYKVGISADELLEQYASEGFGERQHNPKASTETGVNLSSGKVQVTDVPTKEGAGEAEQESQATDQEQRETGEDLEQNVVLGKLGDTEAKIPLEAMVTLQTDTGKSFEISISDALKAASGQETFNRQAQKRVNDIVTRERTYTAHIGEFNNKIEAIINQSKSGDFFGVMHEMARWAKKPYPEYEAEILNTLTKIGEEYGKLTPEEREAQRLKRTKEYIDSEKLQIENERSMLEQERSMQAEMAQIDAQRQEFIESEGIAEGDFWKMFEDVAAHYKQNGWDVNEISVDTIKEYANEVKVHIKTNEVIAQLPPEYTNFKVKTKTGEIKTLENIILGLAKRNPSFDNKTIIEIITQTYPPHKSVSVENLNRKVSEANSKGFRTFSSGQASSQGKNVVAEPTNWDEL